MNRKQRESNRANAEWLKALFGHKPICPNCGEVGRHFAPPCFGEEGFYTCKTPEKGLCK